MSDTPRFVTPRADAIARMACDLVTRDDPRNAMIREAAEDMQRMERFLQSCFLDFHCECADYNRLPGSVGPTCRACTAREIYRRGLNTVRPSAYATNTENPK